MALSSKTVVLLAAAARGASDVGSEIVIPPGCKEAVILLACSAATGTAPTLNVYLQDAVRAHGSEVAGAAASGTVVWTDHASFTQLTAAANRLVRLASTGTTSEGALSDAALTAGNVVAGPLTDRVRVKYTIGGTAPSFTFSVVAYLTFN